MDANKYNWGLGIGPIPNPQSPIPNPHVQIFIYNFKDHLIIYIFNKFIFYITFKNKQLINGK